MVVTATATLNAKGGLYATFNIFRHNYSAAIYTGGRITHMVFLLLFSVGQIYMLVAVSPEEVGHDFCRMCI